MMLPLLFLSGKLNVYIIFYVINFYFYAFVHYILENSAHTKFPSLSIRWTINEPHRASTGYTGIHCDLNYLHSMCLDYCQQKCRMTQLFDHGNQWFDNNVTRTPNDVFFLLHFFLNLCKLFIFLKYVYTCIC